ncbi:MAG: hypothetical protein EOO99_05685 [Pedobacter sp.]|nr:MAG: hypothetical protein EOO99_05685 [Pedobacter sp.]
MKKFANTNPFILLLAPIFAMMILTFAYNKLNHVSGANLVRKNSSVSGKNIVKIIPALIK